MAKYTVTHLCGHEDTHQIVGPVKDRDRKAAWLADRDCGECYRAGKDKALLEAGDKAAVETIGLDLPQLQGSDRQVAWAETIRAAAVEQLAELERIASLDKPGTPLTDAEKSEIRESTRAVAAGVLAEPAARWWIDNRVRSYSITWLLEEVRAKGLAPNFLAKFDAYLGFVRGDAILVSAMADA